MIAAYIEIILSYFIAYLAQIAPFVAFEAELWHRRGSVKEHDLQIAQPDFFARLGRSLSRPP